MKEIDVHAAVTLMNSIFIDVRSPIEFENFHIPDAVNVPLFTDEERNQLGTIYKQNGKSTAKRIGLEILSPKIPTLMNQIEQKTKKGIIPVIYCWRGGLRSKTVSSLSELMGIDGYRLIGGIKKYRSWVLNQWSAELLPEQFIVLHGMTGVGKTLLLHKLAHLNIAVLDIEGCAGHRGSVFGGIGKPMYSQKMFESHLLQQLQKIAGLRYTFIEAENKRIGKVIQPDFLLEATEKGIHIYLQTTLSHRVQRIYDEYVASFTDSVIFKERVIEAITPIYKRFSIDLKNEMNHCLKQEDYMKFIEILLVKYYDPRYKHKLNEYEGDFHHVNTDDLDDAVQQLIAISQYNK